MFRRRSGQPAPPQAADLAPPDRAAEGSAKLQADPKLQLLWTPGLVAAIWIASDVGYFQLLPLFGLRLSYSASPGMIALYYALWIAVTASVFWPIFRGWKPLDSRLLSYAIAAAAGGSLVLFVVYALPLLPPIVWTESWDAPDLMRVTSWYFLPKSVDILFQQLLIAALVLTLSAQGYSLRVVAGACALLFGAAHLLLAFGGMPVGYVTRFTAAAMAFGFVFPYLILRVRNGFAYSYVTHWTYYAVTVVMAHTLSPYAT